MDNKQFDLSMLYEPLLQYDQVLTLIASQEKTVSQVHMETGFSKATCYRIIRRCNKAGIVKASRHYITPAGKRITYYRSKIKNLRIVYDVV